MGHDDGGRATPARRDLWGSVLHDLRQPIQTLLLLTRVLADSDNAAIRRTSADHMEKALLQVQSMLEALGRLSRLEAGVDLPHRQDCDLGHVLDSATEGLGGVVHAAGRRLTVSPCGTAARCDVALLQTMLRGIVGYAVVHGKGDIEIGCRRQGSAAVVACRYAGAADGPPHYDAFLDLGSANRAAIDNDPVPGLAYVERLGDLTGARLSHLVTDDGRHQLALDLEAPD